MSSGAINISPLDLHFLFLITLLDRQKVTEMANDKVKPEEIEQLIEDNLHVFELKEDLLENLDGHDLDDIEKAIMMAITDIYIHSCSSRDEAIDRMAQWAAKVVTAVSMFDQNGACVWNTKQ